MLYCRIKHTKHIGMFHMLLHRAWNEYNRFFSVPTRTVRIHLQTYNRNSVGGGFTMLITDSKKSMLITGNY